MFKIIVRSRLAAAVLCLVFAAGCASSRPVLYRSVPSTTVSSLPPAATVVEPAGDTDGPVPVGLVDAVLAERTAVDAPLDPTAEVTKSAPATSSVPEGPMEPDPAVNVPASDLDAPGDAPELSSSAPVDEAGSPPSGEFSSTSVLPDGAVRVVRS